MGSKSWALLFGIPMLIFSATAIYYLYKKDEDDYDDMKVRTSRCRTLEMKIPKDTIGVLIGRGGSNIKEIETKSDTRIKFSDDVSDEEFRTCIIRGSNEAVQLAEVLIHDCIMSQPLIETYEMWVPKNAMGRIIGKCGDTIKGISRASCAKVSADSISASDSHSERRIIVKGTAEQIAVAKSLIEEKVEEDIEMRKKFDERTANRYPRSKPMKALSNVTANADFAGTSEKHSTEKLESVVSDGSMQIFVSAVCSPKKFWVQVISPKSVKLDHLVDQMTDYYNSPENKELHTIKELEVGQIVAAPFLFDEKWYRAEVCDIKHDDYDPNSSKVSLYYVDYGDEGEQPRSNLLQLRTDFLTLHFQAIECCLARVKPREGEKWSSEATDLFEELCHVALWRPLTARVVSYNKSDKKRGDREGSPVPSVDLFDPEKEIDVGSEMIAKGFAVPLDSGDSFSSENSSPKKSPIHDSGHSAKQIQNSIIGGGTSNDVELHDKGNSDASTSELPTSSDTFISAEAASAAKKNQTTEIKSSTKLSSESISEKFLSNEFVSQNSHSQS